MRDFPTFPTPEINRFICLVSDSKKRSCKQFNAFSTSDSAIIAEILRSETP